ncbi:MAG: hypothetical protein QF441_05055 [Bacteriovoracaceae bacterium]|jgi:hypothetical protein|nr:hypothetical protein [Bacteriovoracaceae bacterium]
MQQHIRSFIPASFLVFISGFTIFLYGYTQLLSDKSDHEYITNQIGTIKDFTHDARVKRSSSFQWSPLKKAPLKLADHDKVFTHKNSHSIIKLKSGHIIYLNELSLVEVTGAQSLNLEEGQYKIELKKNEVPLNIKIGKKEFFLQAKKNSFVSIQKNNFSESKITVTKGEVNINFENQSYLLTQNENKILKSTSSSLYKLEPDGDSFYTNRPKYLVQFKKNNKLLDSFFIDNTSKFKKAKTYTSTSEISLPPGKYFWKTKDSPIAYFNIYHLISPPVITSPALKQIFYTSKQNRDIPIKIKGLKGYEYSINLFTEQKQLLHFQRSEKEIFKLKKLVSGKYFIQAKQKKEFSQSKWSPPRSFEIIPTHKLNLKSIAIEISKPNQEVEFNWNTSNDKQTNLFQLSSDPDFKRIIISRKTKSLNSTKIVVPDIGTYYWRSMSLNESGEKVYNHPVKVIIRPTPNPKRPQKLPNLKIKYKRSSSWLKYFKRILDIIIPSAYAKTSKGVVVKIPKIDAAKSYQIEIFSNKKLTKKVLTKETNKTTFKWSPPFSGIFYWRVRYTDHWGRMSQFSEPAQIEVEIIRAQDKVKNKTPPKLKNKIAQKKMKTQSFFAEYAPTYLTYRQSSTPKVLLDGIVANGIRLGYKHQSVKPYISHYNLFHESYAGKVFNEHKFSLKKTTFEITSQFHQLGLSLQFSQQQKYKLNSQNTSVRSTHKVTKLKLGPHYKKTLIVGKNAFIDLDLAFLGIQGSDYKLKLSYRKNSKKALRLYLGAEYFFSKTTEDELTYEYEYLQILTGLKTVF